MDSIRLAEFVGLPSALGWSHVATVAASSGARSIICFSVSGMQASAVGHEIVAITRSNELETEQQLYDLVISLNTKVQERSCQLSIAAGFLDDEKGSWITSNGVVGLQRDNKFGRALTSSSLQMRTGVIRPNDIFVLATTAAAGMLDDVAELFQQGYQLNGVESSLERLIRTQPHQDQSALALVECLVNEQEVPQDDDSVSSTYTSAQIDEAGFETASAGGSADRENHTELDRQISGVQAPTAAVKPSVPLTSRLKPIFDALGKTASMVKPIGSRIGHAIVTSGGRLADISQRTWQVLRRTFRQLPWSSWRESKKVRLLVLIGAGLALVITASVVTIIWQRDRVAAVTAEAVSPYRTQLQFIQDQASTDPLRAQAGLVELSADINGRIMSESSKPLATALQAFLVEVRHYEDVLKGEQAVRSLPVVLDLQTIIPGFVTTLADGLPGLGLYVDLSKKIAVLVNFSDQSTKEFDLSLIKKIQSISVRSSTQAIILGDGLYTLDLDKAEAPVLVRPVGDSNRAATLVGTYDSYVYIFNPEKRNLFRHLVRKDGYSEPIGWLLSPLGIPADAIHSLKVDGDVWLSTKDGQIKKFTSGRITGFQPSNLEQALEGPVQLYTSENDQYLYAFTPTQQRVVVMTKDGIFVKQIKSEVLSGALAVIAHEAAGQLYIISGSVIYQAKL